MSIKPALPTTKKSPHIRFACMAWPLATLVFLSTTSARAEQADDDIFNFSLVELGNIQITSVSKKKERLADAAASVFVITTEDLRRTGATSLPEALRLAPNLQVAQTSASGYSISARGFNSSSANKLLVLIDGRSVYTPLFAGVFWDVQDVMLEDVERIEVISGPGGTLWGSNAVNGVINIITRAARNTQGVLASADVSNHGGDGAARYGARLENGLAYRIYGKYRERKHTEMANGDPVRDAAYTTQIGFLADWSAHGDQFSVRGDAYQGAEDQPAPGAIVTNAKFALGPISLSGANLLARWEHPLAPGGQLSVQAYFDRTRRTVVPTFGEALDMVDIQLQHSLPAIGMHQLVWGAGHRASSDHLINSQYFAFLPADVHQKWSSLFAQDDISLSDQLRLTVGARIERNDYTGSEVLPSTHLAWKLAPEQTLWGALSRTVRAPSRLDRDPYVPGAPPYLLNGGAPVRSELATVYELGYRGQPTSTVSFSATAFHTVYDHLRTQEIAPDRRSFVFSSLMEGTTSGVEMWTTWQVTGRWRLNGGYTALHERLRLKPGSSDTANINSAAKDPAHKLVLRSSLDLSERSQWDVTISQVAALSAPEVPAYTSVDMRLAWKPNARWEFSVGGHNLTGAGHGEFTAITTRSQIERNLDLKLVARF